VLGLVFYGITVSCLSATFGTSGHLSHAPHTLVTQTSTADATHAMVHARWFHAARRCHNHALQQLSPTWRGVQSCIEVASYRMYRVIRIRQLVRRRGVPQRVRGRDIGVWQTIGSFNTSWWLDQAPPLVMWV